MRFWTMDLNYYSIVATAITIALCFKIISAKNDVQLASDSPTTIGGTTTLIAKVVNCYGPLEGQTFRYTLQYFTKKVAVVKSSSYNFSISDWKSIGKYKVQVLVEKITKGNYKNCGSDTIDVIITDTITASIKTSPSGEYDKFYIGPVFLSVNIHDPSHMFRKPNYYWDFGDGIYINNTQLGELSHNFTQIKTCYVKVVIFAMANGKMYNGTASKEMKFEGDFKAHVIVIDSKNSSSLRLPSSDHKLSYVSLGHQVLLVIKYNNPYSIVRKCYAQWSIGGSGNTCSFKHTFLTKGKANIYVTPTLETKQRNISIDPFQKQLIIEEPISGLTLEHNNYTLLTKYLEANISCEGAPPFKMCWKLSMYSSSGHPLIENCTGLSDNCRFYINRTFIHYKGKFQLDITVINRVGSDHLVKYFFIPEPAPPHHHSKEKEAISAVVPIVICIIVAIILIYVIRKVYKIRHRSVLETANFDFRDEDCQSVDSLNLGKKWCPSFRFWKKNKEYFPLLENWDKRHSSSSLYSDIL